MSNTDLWDKLGKTDPSHTKSFTRGGGFRGTAIKPMWSYRRMTEEFGPCGTGWGIGAPQFQVLQGADDEKLVFCTVTVWYGPERHELVGVGGDKAVGKFSTGLKSDDEAFKKSFTDAVTNALKMIGVGADVHMGMFDDSKYVNSLKEEFSEPANEGQKRVVGFRDDGTRTSHALKKEQPDLMADLDRECDECKTLLALGKLKDAYREKASVEKWNKSFMNAMKEIFDRREQAIMDEADRLASAPDSDLAGMPARETLNASLNILAGG